jgi:hypothetical protein
MNNKIKFFFFLIIAAFSACQYPVNNSTLPDARQFVQIEAEMTESYGKVNVTYSLTGVTTLGGYSFPKAPKAVVYVLDSRGGRTDFAKTDGTQNPAFRGIVGETYRLFVEVDGKKYESNPETMAVCPELDSLAAPYNREAFRAESDENYDGFDVYAFTKDVPNKENYYQWDWIHYERASYCDSKFVAADAKEVLIKCNTFDCWNISYNTRTLVLSDKLRDGQAIAHRVVRIPFSVPPNKYYLRIEQRSITPSVYTYLKSIETQTQSTGTLFDVPAQTKFSTNIHNVNTPDEKIIGVFNVFSFRRKIIYVDRGQRINGAQVKVFTNPIPFAADPLLATPCVEGLFRTKIRPEGWVD